MKDEIYDYALKLAHATREQEDLQRGASSGAAIALVKMTKASAWLSRWEYVTPDGCGCG